MGLLSDRVDKGSLKPGDHIYSWRAHIYAHHGIYIGDDKVIHFVRRGQEQGTGTLLDVPLVSSVPNRSHVPCPTCTLSEGHGVTLSCLNCFLAGGALYRFEYAVSPAFFLAKVRGGTCTLAVSDPDDIVINRANCLLIKGFGNYNVFNNNCEDFAIYCKTELLVLDQSTMGLSGQAVSTVGGPLATGLSIAFGLVTRNAFRMSAAAVGMAAAAGGVVTVAAATAVGTYSAGRYAADIGIRRDAVKVPVEDLTRRFATGTLLVAEPCLLASDKALAAITSASLSEVLSNIPELNGSNYSDWKDQASLSEVLSNIPELKGSNYSDWKDQVLINLRCLDLDLCLRVDEPALITPESSEAEKATFDTWERSNRLSLMIIKSKIAKHIRKSIPELSKAREFMESIETRFKASDKALAATLMVTLTTKKYDGASGVRDHILEMNNLAEQLKTLDMTISESSLVQFVLNSLPPQFGPFKIAYNTQKDKWSINEIISMCVQEEERLKREGLETVHLVSESHNSDKLNTTRERGRKPPSKGKTEAASTNGDTDVRCYFCQKKGHMQQDCLKRKTWFQTKEKPPSKCKTEAAFANGDTDVRCYFCQKKGHKQRDCLKRKMWFQKKGIPFNVPANDKGKDYSNGEQKTV